MKSNSFLIRLFLRAYYLITFVVLSQTLNAQTTTTTPSDNYRTVFHRGNQVRAKVSGYLAIVNELSLPTKSNKIGTFYSIGGELGILLNQRFFMGGYSMVSLAPFDLEKNDNNADDLKFLQIGGVVGFKSNPNRPLHVVVGTKIGYAGLHWVNTYDWELNRFDQHIDGWMVMPQVKLEANIFSWMQAHVGVGYRWVFAEEKYGINPNQDLRQANLQFGIAFGYFK
jgi:hypothetical protein